MLSRATAVQGHGRLIAILVPHAGYDFSGLVAAQGFRQLDASWKTVVLLGTAHQVPVRGAALYARGSYQTPLGPVPIDEALARQLSAASPLFEDNPDAHEREHSIEVELPFLQKTLTDFKVVPMLLNTPEGAVAREIGERLAETLRGRKTLLVISSDLSHYPEEPLAKAVDATTLVSIQEMNPELYWQTSEVLMGRHEKGLECTACGQAAIMAGITAARKLGANEVVLMKYLDSGDVPGIGDPNRTVGYAALAFYHREHPSRRDSDLPEGLKTELLAQARTSITEDLAGTSYSPKSLSKVPQLNFPAAVFVTLIEGGQLRGCIGTTEQAQGLLEAVRYFARAAAFQDARFRPLKTDELPKIKIEISLLSPMRAVSGARDIKPGQGARVEKGRRVGIFLPEVWKELPNRNQFLAELCEQKAGLSRDCDQDPDAHWSTFTTQEFSE